MNDIYESIEEHNPNEKRKMLIIFYDLIANILKNKKPNPTVTESFIRGRKLSNSLVYITQTYFAVPKNIRENSGHYFIIKIQVNKNFNKLRLIIHQLLTFKTLRIYVKNHIFFLVTDAVLASDNLLRFRKNLLERILKTNHDK